MKISEVCERCDVSPHTLRYYENIGLLSPIRRTSSGIRDYKVNAKKFPEIKPPP